MAMYLVNQGGPIPGTVLKVTSQMPLVEHYGMCYWPDPLTQQRRMIHGMKNDVFRITSMEEFDGGQPSTSVWGPQTWEQQFNAIARMESLLGRPWDLVSLNCEQGVMWALTDKPISNQLAGGIALAGLAVVIAFGFAAFD
jgi:hypothetical protein